MIVGPVSGIKDVAESLKTEYHDVLCTLGFYVWQDISLPCEGGAVLRIPDGDELGDLFPYQGVILTKTDGMTTISYALGGYLVAFRSFEDYDGESASIGAGCREPSLSVEDALRIVSAVGMDWKDSPEGFVSVSDEIHGEDRLDHYRMTLECGLSVCVDCSEAWVEIDVPTSTGFYDITSVTCRSDALTIDTERCVFIIPIKEGSF